MGMDVYGKAPKNEHGKYFRASIFSWPPILQLMQDTCVPAGVLTEEECRSMSFNDGAGPDTQEVCDKIADLLEETIGLNPGVKTFESEPAPMAKKMIEVFLGLKEGGKFEHLSSMETETDVAHVEEWIRFLRNCGGFEVN